MENFIEAVVAISIAVVIGLGVRCFIEWAVPEPKRPTAIVEDDWQAFVERVHVGKWIGFFERLLILVSFWMREYTIIAGWLGFKVAAKWEAWTNIILVPTSMGNIPPLAWYQARKQFGSWVLSRFLIGTLINILIGALATYFGRNSFEFVNWLCATKEMIDKFARSNG